MGAIAIGAALVALGFTAARGDRAVHPRSVIGELALLAVAPVLLAFVAGRVFARPVFVPRYLLVAAPAWWLLIGAAVVALGGLTAGARDVLERDFRTRATVITFAIFTLAAGIAREIRGGEKIAWDAIVGAIAADARAAGTAHGTIYSLEGFTALPAAWYAAQDGSGLRVSPVADIAALGAPAWLVVRSGPDGGPPALGDGLMPRGARLEALRTERVPSHSITAYRVRAP